MDPSRIDSLRAQLDGPRDGALLRFSLGKALLDSGDTAAAALQLRAALEFDANYSAAWKLLGKACLADGDVQAAAAAWERGVEVAENRGDIQAAREMRVFRKRLARPAADSR